MSGRPQIWWRDLGRRERMRVDSPAARMMAVSLFMARNHQARGMPEPVPHPPVRNGAHLESYPVLLSSRLIAKMTQDPLNSVGKRRRKFAGLSRRRVDEGEAGGVERHPAESRHEGLEVGISMAAPGPTGIGLVTDERMADRRQVDANLVGAARLEPALDEGGPDEALQHPEPGHRALALPGRQDGHAHPRARVAPDRLVDHTGRYSGD